MQNYNITMSQTSWSHLFVDFSKLYLIMTGDSQSGECILVRKFYDVKVLM